MSIRGVRKPGRSDGDVSGARTIPHVGGHPQRGDEPHPVLTLMRTAMDSPGSSPGRLETAKASVTPASCGRGGSVEAPESRRTGKTRRPRVRPVRRARLRTSPSATIAFPALAALLTFLAGVLDILSAITPGIRSRARGRQSRAPGRPGAQRRRADPRRRDPAGPARAGAAAAQAPGLAGDRRAAGRLDRVARGQGP